jgi:hypothetical protein
MNWFVEKYSYETTQRHNPLVAGTRERRGIMSALQRLQRICKEKQVRVAASA